MENDDPYGVFMFDPDTRDQYIAEDFYTGSDESTVTNLTVVRLQGAYGTAQVSGDFDTDFRFYGFYHIRTCF